MDNEIRLKLQLLQFADAQTARGLMAELEAQCRSNAEAFEQDRISAGQFGAASKELQSALRSVQSALAQFDDAEDEAIESLGQQVTAQIAAAESAERLAQAESTAAAAAKSQADYAALLAAEERAAAEADAEHAHALELEAAAIQHETVMLRTLADQTREETEAGARWAQQQREGAAAAGHLEAASNDLNAALRRDAAAEATARLRALEAEGSRVGTEFAKGSIAANAFVSAMDRIDNEAAQVRAELRGLTADAGAEATAVDRSATSMQKFQTHTITAGAGTRNLGLAALEASRGLEDLQYGVGGMINNLPSLTMYLGGTAGVGAAISGLTVGTYVLYKQWDNLTALFSNTTPIKNATAQIGELEAKIKGFEEKKILLAVDVAQLDDARRKLDALRQGQAEYEAQQKRQTVAEAESGKLVQEALDQARGGAPGITERLVEQRKKEIQDASIPLREARADEASATERLEAAKKLQASARNEQEAQAAEAALELAQRDLRDASGRISGALGASITDARAQIGETIRQAREGHGDVQLQQQRNIAQRMARLGEGGAAFDTAADLERFDEQTKAFDRAMDRAKAAGALRRETAARAKKADTAVAKEFKQSLDDELAILTGEGEIEKTADKLTSEAKAQGLKGAAAFKHVKDGIDKAITDALIARGFVLEEGREGISDQAIGDLATRAASKARIGAESAEGQGGKKQGGAIARFDAKRQAELDKEADKTFETSLKGSGAASMAGELLAQAQAQGGMTDRQGRFHKMTADQIRAEVTRQVEQWLHRQVGTDNRGRKVYANAGMGSEETGLTATRIVDEGRKDVEHRVAGLAGQNLTNTGKLLAVAGQLDAEVGAMQEKSRQMQGQIDGLMRQVNARQRSGARR